MNLEKVGKLIEENVGLVYKVVSHFYVSKYDRDDLVQAGLMGLQYAIEHFDEELGNTLSTYAIPFIIGSVKKELNNIKMLDDYIEEMELIVDESTKSNNENDYCEVIKNLDKKMHCRRKLRRRGTSGYNVSLLFFKQQPSRSGSGSPSQKRSRPVPV